MRFALVEGLVLRQGARKLELVRQLNDEEYQFEDTATRRPITITRGILLKRIWDKIYEIVAGEPEDIGATNGAKPNGLVTLDSLSQAERNDIRRKLAYIKALQKAHVTRGQRDRIAPLVVKVAARLKDPNPLQDHGQVGSRQA
jgi:hypothetical protein